MDSRTLPESAEQTTAHIELYQLLRTQCEAVRKGDRLDLSEVAIQESKRLDAHLAALKRHALRFGPRKGKVAA